MFKKKIKMSEEDFKNLQYPIGPYKRQLIIIDEHIKKWKKDIAELPYLMRKVTSGIREKDLSQTYRPDGWNARQVVHHVADSHMNAYIRFKWALTEDTPMIKAYDEKSWAELYDSRALSIEVSLKLIDALHQRWYFLLDSFKSKDWAKAFDHPEYEKPATLDQVLGMYSWHGKHHVGHLQIIREQLKY